MAGANGAVGTAMAAPLLSLHSNTLMLLYKSAKKLLYTMSETYSLARPLIYYNRAVKYSNKAFRLDGTSDSAVTRQSVSISILYISIYLPCERLTQL